ncbi:MAG: single-stranded DNA-binding protein [Methylocystis sp.]|uniref:single-stranded DNA-binding protein n=1 Tax=Methylocystis sp. TaxID=1911079 RepID=UPI003DA501B7
MAGSVNKVILVGRLGRDPDVRTTQGGQNVVSFSIATDETWIDKASGERKQRTEWHNVVLFNEGLAKVAENYLKKGSRIYVEGMQCTREYTDRDGHARKITEVVLKQFRGELCLLDAAGARPAPEEGSYGLEMSRGSAQQPRRYDDPRMAMGDKPAPQRLSDQLDDDIPF